MEDNRFKRLFERYLSDDLSAAELRELGQAIREDRHAGQLEELLKTAFTDPSAKADDPTARQLAFNTVMAHIRSAGTAQPKVNTSFFQKYRWLAGAAAVLCIAAGLSLFVYIRRHQPAVNTAQFARNDIRPGSNKAILTLANGTQIRLEEARKGQLARQGNMVISKTADGKIVYAANAAAAGPDNTGFNSMSTPRGGQGDIVLPDGTLAQLNAASSIRYPIAFNGKTRQVEITGEVYFEVAHNAAKPFLVKSGEQVVKVLGTHFDVNAYADEPVTRTTLLEGSVEVTRTASGEISRIKPGQQAILGTGIFKIANVQTEDAVAWKNGYFKFSNESLESAMRKISRWYDVDITFTDNTLKSLNAYGTLNRFSNVSKALELLELSGEVKFRIEGRRIIVNKNKP